jgi:hypothetical protein
MTRRNAPFGEVIDWPEVKETPGFTAVESKLRLASTPVVVAPEATLTGLERVSGSG